MEMQQKYGYMRSTVLESKRKAGTSADVHLDLVANLPTSARSQSGGSEPAIIKSKIQLRLSAEGKRAQVPRPRENKWG